LALHAECLILVSRTRLWKSSTETPESASEVAEALVRLLVFYTVITAHNLPILAPEYPK
jgi:hypothetical protein